MKILVPKRWMSVQDIADETIVRPTFFLGGPIRGGGDWQHLMCLELQKNKWLTDPVIACPCRWDESHALARYFVTGPIHCFARQLNWERHYLELAGLHRNPGCIIFYLPCESAEAPHPGPEPYGMDTRGELGEWRMRMKHENARVVIGADASFHGLSQIQRNFSDVLGYDFPIYNNIEQTTAAAVRIALGK